MIVRVIFAIVLIGLSADLIVTQGMYQDLFFLWQNWIEKVNKSLRLFKECKNEEKRPLQGECEWYQLCKDGRFVAKRCPTYGTGQRQIFNPIIGNCTENKKLPLDGQCQLYRQCLVVESVSPFGKWYTVSCEAGQHFEQEIQNCIPSNISTCGKLKGFHLQAGMLNQLKMTFNKSFWVELKLKSAW